MKYIFLIVFLIFSLKGYSQVNHLGNPFIKNFDPVSYRGMEQNWSITQDSRGVIYIGNHAGVIEYDGVDWRMIPVDNNSVVRMLEVDKNGRVYVGAVGEFGYITPDMNGVMQYFSLLDKIDKKYHEFSDVWKIYAYDNYVLFSTRCGFFTYDINNDTVSVYRHSSEFRNNNFPLFNFVIDSEIYLGTYMDGLTKLRNGSFEVVPNGNFFKNKNIFAIIPYDENNLMVCTDQNGVSLYNTNTYEINNDFFPETTQNILKELYLFNAIKLPDNRFGFATGGGVVITDKKGNIEYIVNESAGLQDDVVYYIYHNSSIKDSPVWMALNNGISYTNVFNPIMQFSEVSGFRGLIVDIIEFNNTIVVATTSGAYYLNTFSDSPPRFVNFENIRVAINSFDIWKNPNNKRDYLIAGGRGEVFIIDESFNVRSITADLIRESKTHNTFEVHVSKFYPDRIYLGLSTGLEYIQYINDNLWVSHELLEEHRQTYIDIIEVAKDKLWLSSPLIGYVKTDLHDFKLYSTEHGLPDNLNFLKLFEFDDRILFVTSEGIYIFDSENERFVRDPAFPGNIDKETAGYFDIAEDSEGNLWMSRYFDQQEVWIEMLEKQQDESFKTISRPFKALPSLWCDAVYVDSNNTAWFGISNQLFSFNTATVKDYEQPFNALIRNVSTLTDSLLFGGTNFLITDLGQRILDTEQSEQFKPVLNYELNNLEFTFSAPFFESQEKIEYSYKLDGFDDWSRWSTSNQAIYSYIPVGTYDFMVKARNVYGVESEIATFNIVILPPWYRTIWAYIAYAILLILAVYGIIVLNTRRLKREKEILEGIVRERTAEVVKQKDEIEQQRDKIAKQNESITNSIEYAKRIQTAALPPAEYIDKLLPERFILFMPRDIVSGDFYWLGRMGNRIVAVAADCTGHGVPGGFMSMLGIAYLNQIISSSNNLNAGEVLDQLRNQVMKSLRQKDEASESRDGMDIAMFIYDVENSAIDFAGANNPLFLFRDNELHETSGDRMPIGIHRRADRSFENHRIEVKKGDMLYMFSDGYKDQFGGPEGKKFMNKNFKQLLLDIHLKPMEEQRDILEKTIVDWSEGHERIDDIIVMGVRIT